MKENKQTGMQPLLVWLLRLNDHAAILGPLYLLWRGEFRACLRWYALPAALLVLLHGALSWGAGHALPLLAQGAGYAMAACVVWMAAVNLRFAWAWHALPHTGRRSLLAPLLAIVGYGCAVALVMQLGCVL